MLLIEYLEQLKKAHFRFFVFVWVIFILYVCQLILKTEITPIGYFSLYSNTTAVQNSYPQILPVNHMDSLPANIYQVPGSGFIMLEILPSRYQILSESDHCNQMNHKLQRIGLHDKNKCDCIELKKFHTWFRIYAKRQGIILNNHYRLVEFGFLNGKIINQNLIHGKD